MSTVSVTDYVKQIDSLTETINAFQNSSFDAKLVVKGYLLPSLDDNIPSIPSIDLNIFDYVDKSFKGQYIRITGVDSSQGFDRRAKASEPTKPFDDFLIMLCKSSRDHGGFEVYSDGCHNNHKKYER